VAQVAGDAARHLVSDLLVGGQEVVLPILGHLDQEEDSGLHRGPPTPGGGPPTPGGGPPTPGGGPPSSELNSKRPSTGTAQPYRPSEAELVRKPTTRATSSGDTVWSKFICGRSLRLAGVSAMVMTIAFAWTPFRFTSCAMDWTHVTSAALAAA